MGSRGMLIGAYIYVKEKKGESEAKRLFLYGQEVNPTTYALAEMNMILHGIGAVRGYGLEATVQSFQPPKDGF